MSDELRGLDRWIEREDGELTRGNGEPQTTPKLICQSCDWRGPFTNAAAHHELTGHTLLYRGVPQVFSQVDPGVRRQHQQLYGTQPDRAKGAA